MPASTQGPPISAAPLSVVLTACNDEPELAEVVTAWVHFLDGLNREYEIILVNDGSSDGTRPAAESLLQRFSRLTLKTHPLREGLGSALRTGIGAARYPLVFYTLCNRQYQPADLTRLLEILDKKIDPISGRQIDLVTGYRVGKVPGWLVWPDRLKRWLVRAVFGMSLESRDCWTGWSGFSRRWLSRWVFGVRVRDPECVYCLLRRHIFARIPIQCDSSFALIEILAKANFQGCWMAEAPVTCLASRARGDDGETPRRMRREIAQLFRAPDFGPAVLDDSPAPAWATSPPVTAPAIATPPVPAPSITPAPVAPPSPASPPLITAPVDTPHVTAPPVDTPSATTPSIATPTIPAPAVPAPPITTPPIATPTIPAPAVPAPPITTPPITPPAVATPPAVTQPLPAPPESAPAIQEAPVSPSPPEKP
jgi:hypothetical protein